MKVHVKEVLAREFAGRQFEVYSVASGKAISRPANFNYTYAVLESYGVASGFDDIPNGIDIREVRA